ncbi:MAG TPA: hypothetical protein PKD85_00105 [Saprospiraceae bacterium]|nr:hypothetical protein [Saprospiraceae bacterium]
MDTRFYKISILGFRFLRRIRKLIIKRGGGARAFKELNLLNFNLTPGLMAAIKTAGGPKDRKFFNPFVFIVRNLRTHFFLRKHTKFRKTRLIPGILFKRRRLRVIGRWFMKSVKAKNERRFRDCLMGAAVETINNEGPAIDIRNAFNEQVFASKVNIIVRKRRRTRGRRKLKTLTDLKIKRLERNEKRKKLIKQKTFR